MMVGMKWVVLLVLANVLWWLNPVAPVLAADQIIITAQVLPQPADLPVTLTALNPPVGDTGPSTTLEYQISYENLYSSSSPLTVQASWSLATVEGSMTPSIPLLSYVPGSATAGYAGTLPVIDTIQRTITWSIASLPAGSGPQTVDFSLITSVYDSAALQLSFTVAASATAPISTVPSEVDVTYRDGVAPSPTPTPAPTPTPTPTPTATPSTSTSSDSTPTPTPTPAPTPTPTIAPLVILSVDVLQLSDTTAQLEIQLSEPSALQLRYGASLRTGATTLNLPVEKTTHIIQLNELSKDTQYLFAFTATAADGRKVQSDQYAFTTASQSAQFLTLIEQIRLMTQGALITQLDLANPPVQVVPSNAPVEITIGLKEALPLRSFMLELRLEDSIVQTAFEQAGGSEYIARLSAGHMGSGTLRARTIDFYGNVQIVPLAELVFVPPLLLTDSEGNPVEFAQIFVRKYNPQTRLYELIPKNSLLIENPVRSTISGAVPLFLPTGEYQLDITAPGFLPSTHALSVTPTSSYPVLVLENDPNIVLGRINTILHVANEMFIQYLTQVRGTAISPTLYGTVAFLTTGFFLFFATLALAAKTHIAVASLPSYLWHRTRLPILFSRKKQHFIHGKLLSADTHAPISRARITLRTADTDTVLTSLVTDRHGFFHWRTHHAVPVVASITAVGYQQGELAFSTAAQEEQLDLELESAPSTVHAKSERLLEIGETILGSLFEALLIIALILQVFFFTHTNIFVEALLILGSMVNLAVWSLFQASPHAHHVTRLSRGVGTRNN